MAGHPHTHRTARRALALLACAAWLLGYEALPAIHVGFHGLWGQHAHEGDEQQQALADLLANEFSYRHAHGDAPAHSHGHPASDPAEHPAPAPANHGGHSVAHRGAVVLAPPPVLPVPVAVLLGEVPAPLARAGLRSSDPPDTKRARGPPVA